MTRSFSAPVAAGLCVTLIVFAFVAAPHSCDWGLNAYALAGLVCAISLFALPLVQRGEATRLRRIPVSLGLTALGIAVWIAGLFLANVRIICRLF